jgi:hypothetical protein
MPREGRKMAMNTQLAWLTLAPCDGEDRSKDKRAVTVSRMSSEGSAATAEPTLPLEFSKLAAEIVTPHFAGVDDQTYNTAMVEARNEFQVHGVKAGLVLAKKVLPGIDDAARRFQEHKVDKDYRLNGQDNLTAYVHSLGYKPATLREWKQRLRDQELKLVQKIKVLSNATSAKNGSGKSGKPPRDKYDATDTAHLERVVRAAQDAPDAYPDDDALNSIRDAIQNKPVRMPTVGSQDQIVTLSSRRFFDRFQPTRGQANRGRGRQTACANRPRDPRSQSEGMCRGAESATLYRDSRCPARGPI